MELLIVVILIVNIVLIIKLWQMTSNIWFIKELLKNQNREREKTKLDIKDNYNLELMARILAEKYPDIARKVHNDMNRIE